MSEEDIETDLEEKIPSDVLAKKRNFKTPRASKMNIWMISSIILIIILAGVLIFGSKIFGATTSTTSASNLKPEEAAVKAVKFINDNLVQPNTTASYISSTEFEGV